MAYEELEGMHVVTEQGMFGELDVEDPSKKKIKTKEEIQKEIDAAVEKNKQL